MRRISRLQTYNLASVRSIGSGESTIKESDCVQLCKLLDMERVVSHVDFDLAPAVAVAGDMADSFSNPFEDCDESAGAGERGDSEATLLSRLHSHLHMLRFMTLSEDQRRWLEESVANMRADLGGYADYSDLFEDTNKVSQ